MKEVISEYGSTALGALGAILFLGSIGAMLFSGQGILTQMIAAWGNGGC